MSVFMVSINGMSFKNEWPVNDRFPSSWKKNRGEGLDEMAMHNQQDWSPLSVQATPAEVPAKQIYFTPV